MAMTSSADPSSARSARQIARRTNSTKQLTKMEQGGIPVPWERPHRDETFPGLLRSEASGIAVPEPLACSRIPPEVQPMRSLRAFALFSGLSLVAAHAASPQPAVATAAIPAANDKLSLDQRVWMASKIYSTIQTYFGHWQAIPEFDLDTSYQKYLAQILPTDDRRTFDLATMELFAQLKNGHSFFLDPWLNETYNQPLGFRLVAMDGRQVVVRSRLPELSNGDVVLLLDGRPIDQVL